MKTPISPDQMTEHMQPSIMVIALRLLAILFLLDTVYAILVLGFVDLNNLHEWHISYILLLWLTHTAKYVLISYVIIRLFAESAGRAYYLAGHHIIERIGLMNITETTYELSQVKSVVVKQSWLGRRFDYGTIGLSFAGSTKQQEIVIRDIRNPMKYKEYFDQHLQVQGWVR